MKPGWKAGGFSGFLRWQAFLFFLMIGLAITLIQGCNSAYIGSANADGGTKFSIRAEHATRVAIAGSFNKWNPERDLLSGPDRNGVWQIRLPLPEGRYEYLFVIDGNRWVRDPAAPFTDDGLGGKNSVVYVRR